MRKSIAIAGAALLVLGLAPVAMADAEMCGPGHSMQTVSTPVTPIPVATTTPPVARPGG